MMSTLEFRSARPEDDPQLTALVSEPLPGALSLRVVRKPGFLSSQDRCGPKKETLVAADGKQIHALCSHALWPVRWHGQPLKLWMVSDFRALSASASRGITGQGWKALRRRLGATPAVISLLEQNARAKLLFQKARPAWPKLHPLLKLKTCIYPLMAVTEPKVPSDLELTPVGNEELASFAARQSQNFDLIPDLQEGQTPGLLPSLERLLALRKRDNGEILGSTGLWDTSDSRQVVVHSYGGAFQTAYKAGRALGRPVLPEPGSQVKLVYATCFWCPDPKLRLFLLEQLMWQAKLEGYNFLVTLVDNPTTSGLGLHRWVRFSFDSTVYQLVWEQGTELAPGTREPGVEVAWL